LVLVTFLLFRQVAALLLAGSAAYFDARTGEIPDSLNYSAVLLGVVLNIADFTPVAFLLAGAVFAGGYLFYISGKIGGGDVKLFTALALLIPFADGRFFVADLLLIAGITALIALSLYYPARYILRGINLEDNRKNLLPAGLLFIFSLAYFIFSPALIPSPSFVRILALPFLFASFFLAFERGIRKEFFLRNVPLEALEEDELLASDFIGRETMQVIRGGSRIAKGVLGKAEIRRLKEAGISEIAVYRNLPKFAPFVFAALLILFAFPSLAGSLFTWW
jgi:Flp pilus assembly protein protease CpaA